VRRQVCTAEPKLHRFYTVEVLDSFVNKLGGGVVETLLGYNLRGAQRMRLAYKRRRSILQGVAAGEKYEVIAAEVGVSLALVRKVVKEARTEPATIGRPKR